MDLDIYLSAAPWHKSSYSTGGGQNCVEVAVDTRLGSDPG